MMNGCNVISARLISLSQIQRDIGNIYNNRIMQGNRGLNLANVGRQIGVKNFNLVQYMLNNRELGIKASSQNVTE